MNNDIFILQLSDDNDSSFSCGKILSLKNTNNLQNASTKRRCSGSPIILRFDNNYVVELHYGGLANIDKNKIFI